MTTSTRINALDSFGTQTPNRTDPIAALESAGARFDLVKMSLQQFAGRSANPDLHVVLRGDTQQAIGTVGNHYDPMDNEQFFVPTARRLIEDTGAQIDRFQLLDSGARAFMRLSWPDELNLTIGRPQVGDYVGRRCTLSTSHDGKWAGKMSLQLLRLICSNGMTVPVGKYEFSMTHTVGGRQQLIDMNRMIPEIDRYIRKFEASANILAATPVAPTDPRTLEIIRAMVDPTGKAGEKKSGGANLAQKRVNRVMELFDGGQPGAESRECRGTGWGLYNAGVDYFTHEKGTRGGNASEQRFKSLLPGGPANKEIVRAWNVVTEGLGVGDEINAAVAAA